jgi:hypothetical protein
MPESPSETLRAAATWLRETAAEATPGPWRTHDTHLDHGGHTATVLSGEGNETELRAWLPTLSAEFWDGKRNVWNDARWIAGMSPAVAEPLASWLEENALAASYDVDDVNGHALAFAQSLPIPEAGR